MKLAFSAEKCIGCKLCQLACSATHEGVFNPHKSRLRVLSEYQPDGGLLVKVSICDRCLTCVAVCPVGAVSVQEGRIQLDRQACTGCGACISHCPNQIITLDSESRPRICDLCGGTPWCVAWCPHGALEVTTDV
ncbi:4Fe-4S dicluster domain-containing protein [Desulforamulus hydrothermalis]|uniref:4Fe-4S dicluster domain-containing protein n=1 Tax=Desulforamulus hydrothermalis TaxID=412895 RepID=UPI0002FF8542|nr:4Fe-4S dicluster domain-containing protein [Desulforamulus hydrothermalis]SHH36421.1 Fe-S-cluster-containing hydrogenase component 2 [Desulforamulus hydrothermalis Lam5 = DSM 18033]